MHEAELDHGRQGAQAERDEESGAYMLGSEVSDVFVGLDCESLLCT